MFTKKESPSEQKVSETEKPSEKAETLKPAVPAKNLVNTAGKVGKSHHNFLKVMNQHKQADEMKKISAT